MTYDRFDASLRQHLLDTANERPADGQLAALVEAVAETRQRPSLVARLTWIPGRVGPVPSVALRYGLIGVALLLAAMAGALLAGGGTTPGQTTVFEGTWTSIDPADGSGQTLVVGPGLAPAVYFEDGYASGAACVYDEVKRFTARGTAMIDGDRLDVRWPDGGGCGLLFVEMGDGSYLYDPSNDALVDGMGLTWTRPLAEQRPPTPGPSMDAPTPDVPPIGPSPRPGEATFDSTIHGISINYPAGWQTRPATEPWTGGPLRFDSPEGDVIFDPELGDRLYLVVASQPYGDLTEDDWRDQNVGWLCDGSGGAFGSWLVDDADAFVIGCDSTESAALVFTETRGYLIRLVVSSDEPGLADIYSWDWLKPALASVELRPDDAVDAEAAPVESAEPDDTPASPQPEP